MYSKLRQELELHKGYHHSDVAVVLDNQAKMYHSTLILLLLLFGSFAILRYSLDPKRYKEAEELYNKALDLKKTTLGPKHTFTAITQDQLATLLVKLGRYEEAEKLYHR